ncbi:MAG: SDR family oxidoreductase [Novosphingobium sp.]|nr:SDR family oxidoreductase [Novosphingobium sp.]
MTKTIVLTGAARGIGLQLARAYRERGDTVIATARKLSAAKRLRDLNASAGLEIAQLDVTEPVSVRRFAEQMDKRSIDVLINSAGVLGGDHQSLDDMDFDAWLDAFDVNTLGPFRVTTALMSSLVLSPAPKVITLTSQMGSLHRNSVGQHAYRSSKAAANKVMQVMAVELKDRGIIVCPIHPGWVRTEMGGRQADISVEESARGLLSVIDRLSIEDSGRFWTWEGNEHPW